MAEKTERAAEKTSDQRPAGRLGDVSVLDWERRLRDEFEAGGLWPPDSLGPTYRELRPYGPVETPGFPVYRDLEEHLLRARVHPDPVVAHVLATCAGYSYSNSETLSMIMARLGLESNHCRMITSFVDSMFICSTAFLIQSRSGKVAILCYRGTELVSPVNWLTVADVAAEPMGYYFGDRRAHVHAGFYRNVRATRYQVMQALKLAQHGESVRTRLPGETDGAAPPALEDGLEVLYITGHSLGGAMAALMTVMLKHERKFGGQHGVADLLRAAYTFGQPMIGDPAFAEACAKNDFLREKLIRYIYDNDIVPHLPPLSTGPFQHFGREYRYQIPNLRRGVFGLSKYFGHTYDNRKGDWKEQESPAGQILSILGTLEIGTLSYVLDKVQVLRSLPLPYSVNDHVPSRYIDALTPHGVPNEFGD
ncbi:Lipase (class 3) [Thermomonospora echinospora]|uniref:Lipase (Class 3) n=1 Tax=Thermomonospora echinospora TaxID=1992 RepID=A0A1H6DK03_9ACTN|nr:lipase family protein [Thermomonospora echinospora]SEG85431.1 Lipase (class 3) [Thermomonospora echinospora]